MRLHSSADAMRYLDSISVDYSAIADEAGGIFQNDILLHEQAKELAERERRYQEKRTASKVQI